MDSSHGAHLKRNLVVGLVALGVILVGVFIWYWHAHATAPAGFRTAALKRGDLLATVSATGTFEPEEVVDVGAQVVGMIKAFGRDPTDSTRLIDYGSAVEADTVLAQIDDTLYKAQLDQAKANLQRARADLLQMQAKLRQAERDWTRAQTMIRTNAISEADYDMYQSNYESAKSALAVGEAAIAQAQAALQQAEINLGYTTIKSPVKGVVVDRRVNIGQTVVSSLNAPSLFLIAKDLKRLQVWASVNEADIGSIRPGQAVGVTVDAFPDEVFAGKVSQVRLNATMTQNVVTYTVVVDIDNSAGKLLPYLTANLSFEIDRRSQVLQVPNAALRWRPRPEQVAPEAREAVTQVPRSGETGAGAPRSAKEEKARHDRGLLWVPSGQMVRPVEVRVGLTDGMLTEVVSDELTEGTPVVIGEVSAGGGESTASPFTPRMFGPSGGGQR